MLYYNQETCLTTNNYYSIFAYTLMDGILQFFTYDRKLIIFKKIITCQTTYNLGVECMRIDKVDITKCTLDNLYKKELVIRTRIPKVPLYVMVYDIIYNLIKNGELKPGDKIPSENFWAEYLEVSRSTVRMALLILQEDGILSTQQGKGTFVANQKESKNLQVTGLSLQASEIIASTHQEYSISEGSFRYVNYDRFLYEKLCPQENERIGIINIKHNANDRLVAAGQYFFLLKEDELRPDADFSTAYRYYKNLLNKEKCKVNYSLITTVPNKDIKGMFGNDVANVLLLIRYEVFDQDKRVIYSKDYYNTNSINIELISINN